MRRGLVRFGLLALAIGLLVFLILTQKALQDGLITSFVGSVRNQSAPVLVYNVEGQRSLQGSVITPDLEAAVSRVDGIGRIAPVGLSTVTARHDGEQLDVAIIGVADPRLGYPRVLSSGRLPQAPGEAVGSDPDFGVGDRVDLVVAPGSPPVEFEVVGVARDVQSSVTPTLFTPFESYESAVRAVRPETTTVLPSALAVRPAEGVSTAALVRSIDAAHPDADALTRSDAADQAPGVEQVRQSFQVVFLLYGLVVPLVTGLFFLIVTLQKAGSLTLLRAIGAPTAALARGLVVQVAVVVGLGLVVGIALYALVTRVRVGGLTLRFDIGAVVFWSVLLLVLAMVSAAAALRRIVRIDPMEATVGGGLR